MLTLVRRNKEKIIHKDDKYNGKIWRKNLVLLQVQILLIIQMVQIAQNQQIAVHILVQANRVQQV